MLNKQEKELKERYIDTTMSESWNNDSGMRKYFEKSIDRVVKTQNGYLIALDKPSIKKNFCFGYSDSRYDTDDFDRANNMATHAKNSENYFLEKNLEKVDDKIRDLENDRFVIYTRVYYVDATKDSIIHDYELYRDYQKEYGEVPEGLEELTEADRNALIEAYKKLREDFVKRLHSYLKRYGLSNVNTWTYWRDE